MKSNTTTSMHIQSYNIIEGIYGTAIELASKLVGKTICFASQVENVSFFKALFHIKSVNITEKNIQVFGDYIKEKETLYDIENVFLHESHIMAWVVEEKK